MTCSSPAGFQFNERPENEQASEDLAGAGHGAESAFRVADTWRPPCRSTTRGRPTSPATPAASDGRREGSLTRSLKRARSAERRYQALFDGANDTITILSTDGVVLEANQRWEDVLNLPRGSVVGRHISEFAAPGSEVENARAFGATVACGQGRNVATLLRTDGVPVSIEFSSRVLELDGQTVLFAIGQDVTERIRAAEALRAAEEKYRSLMDRIPEVIWTMNQHGALTYVAPNNANLRSFDVDLSHTSLDCLSHDIHPDERARVLDACSALMRDGTKFDIEYRRKSKAGRWIWLRNRAFATYERDGVRYAEGMLSDISEQKQLAEELRQAQKMEAIGQLTGGIAHDFNNMLVAILANCHFLCEALSEDDPRRSDADEIKCVAERAAALTRQLLAFSRRQVMAPTLIDLNASLSGLQKMLLRLIGEDIEFTLDCASDLHLVRADAGQIEQVVMNLAVNARDAMPNGGQLVIETRNVALGAEAHTPGDYAVFSVRDTGAGIDEDTKRRLFEPFFTTKEAGKGTGLGLSTCYGIVKQSGGWIEVSSELGRGALFTVYLPAVSDSTRRTLEPLATPELIGTETVLLVEDDDRVRAAVSRMLETWGYTPLVARNGQEALAIAADHVGEIQLVVSDMVMPGPSGPELVNQVRARRPEVKALFMSGYSNHLALRSEVLRAANNFIQKPFAPAALAKKVREALDT